jgi:hypothetical protein
LTAFKAQQASAVAVERSLVKAFTDILKPAIRALEWKINHFAEKTSSIPAISQNPDFDIRLSLTRQLV